MHENQSLPITYSFPSTKYIKMYSDSNNTIKYLFSNQPNSNFRPKTVPCYHPQIGPPNPQQPMFDETKIFLEWWIII